MFVILIYEPRRGLVIPRPSRMKCDRIPRTNFEKLFTMNAVPTMPKPRSKITIEQYLALERAAFERSEYYDGVIVAMAGESPKHGLVSANLVIEVGTQLKEGPCFVLTKDSKVRSGIVSARTTKGMFSYPDIMVVCGEPEYFDIHQDVLLNPTAIFEVLSPSTENYDRGEKFHRYQA